MQPSNLEKQFKDHINIFAYSHPNNQKIAAINLWYNGFLIFHGATIVKNFDVYKSVNYTETTPPNFEILSPFILDSLMDDTRIITCFENFMKGILILNGFVVHQLTDNKRELRKEQRTRPIKVHEAFTLRSFTEFDESKPEIRETSFQTLNFSWMLKPNYQQIINLPADILLIIKQINEERNKLHFINIKEFEFGNPTIERYSRIIEFVDQTIKKCMLDLNMNMKDLILKAEKQ